MCDHPEGALRFRLWIEGRLVHQGWADTPAEAAQVRQRHSDLIAISSRSVYMVEIHNPSAPEDQAYIRIGTDPSGMVEPETFTTAQRDQLPLAVETLADIRWGLE